ncbi:MAG: hypothetical protein WDO19_02725 [Bacteroidota bacterium]
MNCGSFDFLKDAEKMQFIKNCCTLVARRRHKNFSYELYQFDSFYIELQIYVHNTISVRYFCFDDISYLEPYLMDIDISVVTE